MTFAPAAGFTPMQSFTDIRPRRASENRRSIYRRAVFTLLCSMTGISSDIEALAQPLATCWAVHVVERGDTLFEVAERAYGNGWLYRQIFEANRDLLPDERSIEVGDQLLIPCLDGTGPGTRAEAIELGLIERPAQETDPMEEPSQQAAPDVPRIVGDEPTHLECSYEGQYRGARRDARASHG